MMPEPGGVVGGGLALAIGALFGWSLERVVGAWLAACEREWGGATAAAGTAAGRPAHPHRVAVAFALATVALWWWEVHALGLLPRGPDGPVGGAAAPVVIRWLAHVVLLWLLSAATWIDFRFRVIPDWITVSGFLAGLAAVWAGPEVLLPVSTLRAREFAAALEVPAVLGWAGPLEVTPERLVPRSPGALLAALGLFTTWWWVATGPADRFADPGGPEADAAGPASDGQGPAEPSIGAGSDRWRTALLVIGGAGVALAWWWGGVRFAALQSSLVGAVVAGGLVWATRAGASLALGREAMGLGDVTLMAMVGAWLGWQACVLGCFLGVLVGLVHGLRQLAGGHGSELPFGPSLCAGVVLVVAGWRGAWGLTRASFAEPGRMAAVLLAVVVGTALSLLVWTRLPGPARRAVLVATLLLLALLVAAVTAFGGL